MISRILPCFLALIMVLSFCATTVTAQDKKKKERATADSILEEPGRLFNIKAPKGFKAEPLEAPGIIKWRKDNAEIYLVVGGNYLHNKKKTFDVLYKAAKKDKRFEKVERVKLSGGSAFLYKEKPPEDPTRLQTWRLMVVTDQKLINVDFSAPGKEFATYAGDFKSALKSFRLRK